jgi:hypothetical protein
LFMRIYNNLAFSCYTNSQWLTQWLKKLARGCAIAYQSGEVFYNIIKGVSALFAVFIFIVSMVFAQFQTRFVSRTLWVAVLSAGVVMLAAGMAQSAPKAQVFLHFGSFEGQSEALERLQAVKLTHAGLLANLPDTVREVEIRPGLSVFRAQAGPVQDRVQAQSICAQFASNGDECYIVETVMAQPDTPSSTAFAAADDGVNSLGNAAASAAATATSATVSGGTSTTTKALSDHANAVQARAEKAASSASSTVSKAATRLSPLPDVAPSASTQSTQIAQAAPSSLPAISATDSVNTLYDKVASAQARQPITATGKAIRQGGADALTPAVRRDAASQQLLRNMASGSDIAARNPPVVITRKQGEGVDIAAREASIEEALQHAARNQPQLTPKTLEQIEETTKEAAWYDTINPFHENEDLRPIQNKPVALAQEESRSFVDRLNPFSSEPEASALNDAPAVSAHASAVKTPAVSPLIVQAEPTARAAAKPAFAAASRAVSPARAYPAQAAAALNQPPPVAPSGSALVAPRSSVLASQKPAASTHTAPLAPINYDSRINTTRARGSALAVPTDLPAPPLPKGAAAQQKLANVILGKPLETGAPLARPNPAFAPPAQAQKIAPIAAPIIATAPHIAAPVITPPASPQIAVAMARPQAQPIAAAPQRALPAPVITAPALSASVIASPAPVIAPAVSVAAQPAQPFAPEASKLVPPHTHIPQHAHLSPHTHLAQAPIVTGAPIAGLPQIPAGTSITDAAKMTDDAHHVAVEEAQRVPLSDEDIAIDLPPVPVIASGRPVSVALEDLPSQTFQTRTLWAHMSFFKSAPEALRFWHQFRSKNPDFPSVRVRVTSAYVSQKVGRDAVSLRVGPFGNADFIAELCENRVIDSADIGCRAIRDLGSASLSRQARVVQPVGMNSGRYGAATSGLSARHGVWVQLGSFASQSRAHAQWDALKIAHKSTLRAMRSQISSPKSGSHSQAVYRLRTGPFVNQTAAEELCVRLKADGTACLVVAEN